MKGSLIKGLFALSIVGFFLFSAMHIAGGAEVGQPAEWSDGDTDGWRLLDAKEGQYLEDRLGVVDSSLEWRYLADEVEEDRVRFWVSADVAASQGSFSGDYFDAGVSHLKFELYADVATELTIELWHAEDFLYYTSELSVKAGWQRIQIPINTDFFSAGFGSSDNVEDWIENIGELLIGTKRGDGAGEQVYRVRNVVLKGSGSGYASWIQTYIDRDGGAKDEWLPGADHCGDGEMNAEEYVAGTDPADPEDNLLIRMGATPWSLRWESKPERIYSVWVADCPGNQFEEISETSISGTGAEVEFAIPTEKLRGNAIYRLEVKLE